MSIDSSDDCSLPPEQRRPSSPTKPRGRAKLNKMINLAQGALSPRHKGRSRSRTKRPEQCEDHSSVSNGPSESEDGSESASLPLRPGLLSPPSILNLSDEPETTEESKFHKSMPCVPATDTKQSDETSLDRGMLEPKRSKTKHGSKIKPSKSDGKRSRRSHKSLSNLNYKESGQESPSKSRRDRTTASRSSSRDIEPGKDDLSTTPGNVRTKHPPSENLKTPKSSKQSVADPSRSSRKRATRRANHDSFNKSNLQPSPLSRKLNRALSISEHGKTFGTDDMRSVSKTVIGLVTPGRTKRGTFSRTSNDIESVPGFPKLQANDENFQRGPRRTPDSPRRRSRSKASRASRSASRTRDSSRDESATMPKSPIRESRRRERVRRDKNHREIENEGARTPVSLEPSSGAYPRSKSAFPCLDSPDNEVDDNKTVESTNMSVMTPASCGKQRASVLSREMKEGLLAGIKKDLDGEVEMEDYLTKSPVKESGIFGFRSKSVGRQTPKKEPKTALALKAVLTPSRAEAKERVLDARSVVSVRRTLESSKENAPVELRKHISRSVSSTSLSGKTKESGRTKIRVRKKPKESRRAERHGAAQLTIDHNASYASGVDYVVS